MAQTRGEGQSPSAAQDEPRDASVSGPEPMTSRPDTEGSWQWRYRIGFAVVGLAVLVVVLLLPVALLSLLDEVRHPPSQRTGYLLPPAAMLATDDYTAIHLDDIALDELRRTLEIRISGYHVCSLECTHTDELIFFSVRSESRLGEGLPPSARISLPSDTAEINATITLPVDGELLRYPFDRYRLVEAIAVERSEEGRPSRMLTPAEIEGRLFMTVQEHIPRLNLVEVPTTVTDQRPAAGDFAYLGVWTLVFVRPIYLQVLVVLAVLMVAVAAACTVLLRPLNDLILNTGGLVLGIWGVRALLLGSLPPNTTVVDVVLTGIILLQLTAVVVRVLNDFHTRGGLRLLPWARAEAGEQTSDR